MSRLKSNTDLISGTFATLLAAPVDVASTVQAVDLTEGSPVGDERNRREALVRAEYEDDRDERSPLGCGESDASALPRKSGPRTWQTAQME